MSSPVETLGALERRVSVSVSLAEIERQTAERLRRVARELRLPGFRPGRVPMRLVEQQYGARVRSEVFGEAVEKAFSAAVREANLRVAGAPRIERKEPSAQDAIEFSATFEVYPEVRIGDLAGRSVERPTVTVDEAAVDRTLEILRQQRAEWVEVARPARRGDRVTLDFDGSIDGAPFEGGRGREVSVVLGAGKLLAEFDTRLEGASAGETRRFELRFPDDYPARALAGKTAAFTVLVRRVDEARVPALDEDFARRLGVSDGDLARLRAEVRANVEREVAKRIEARVRAQALQALLEVTPLELPKSLVQAERQALAQAAAQDLRARGVALERVSVDEQALEAAARRRVALGLIVAELARAEKLPPTPSQVRALIETEAQAYEHPDEVVKWFYTQPQRLAEMEARALESNVVQWVLARLRVVDKAMAFDELMTSEA